MRGKLISYHTINETVFCGVKKCGTTALYFALYFQITAMSMVLSGPRVYVS